MPTIDVTPSSTIALNSLSDLAGGFVHGSVQKTELQQQAARDALQKQVQTLHMQATQADMARAQRQEDLANQQRGAAQDAIGLLTEQSGLPPTVAGVLRRMEPQHAAVAFQEFQKEGARRQLHQQIASDEQNGAFNDVTPDGESKPNPERAAQAKEWTAYLDGGGDPAVVAQHRAQVIGEVVGQRAQANIILGHVTRAQGAVAQSEQAGVDTSEAHRMLETAKIDPSLFEEKDWRMKFQDALRGYATARDGALVSPQNLENYESMLQENAALKGIAQQQQIALTKTRIADIGAAAQDRRTTAQARLEDAKRSRGPASGTVEKSPSLETLYQQAQKSVDARDPKGELTPDQRHAETLKEMGRIRSAKAGFEAKDAPEAGPVTPEQTSASGAGAATKLASPELREADLRANPQNYQWLGGDVEKTRAWIKEGKRQ